MSQKYIKTQNKNNQSAAYGKYYAQAVYDTKFIETEELASFIQTQASVKNIKSTVGLSKAEARHILYWTGRVPK